jgi:hypothetical protein
MKIWFTLPFFCSFAFICISCSTYAYEYVEYDEKLDGKDTSLVSKYLTPVDTNNKNIQIKSEDISNKKFSDITVKGPFTIQLGAFLNESYAIDFVNSASDKLDRNITYKFSDGFYKVVTGNFETKPDALIELEKIINLGFTDSFIVLK